MADKHFHIQFWKQKIFHHQLLNGNKYLCQRGNTCLTVSKDKIGRRIGQKNARTDQLDMYIMELWRQGLHLLLMEISGCSIYKIPSGRRTRNISTPPSPLPLPPPPSFHGQKSIKILSLVRSHGYTWTYSFFFFFFNSTPCIPHPSHFQSQNLIAMAVTINLKSQHMSYF